MVGSEEKVKRRSAPKVKSGCKTCKLENHFHWREPIILKRYRIRRIKCDEARPSCTNCSSTGRTCDGYPPSFQFRTVAIQSASKAAASRLPDPAPMARRRNLPERHQNSEPGDDARVTAIPMQLPSSSRSPQEQYFFTNYYRYLAPRLGGYFDSEFWTIQLPRIAHSEPAVYHAIVAFATLDIDDMLGSGFTHPEPQVSFLFHYNKSIHFLKTHFEDDRDSQVVILLTCLLFICLEFKRGNIDTGLDHLQNGLSILYSSLEYNDTSSELSDISGNLAFAFSRLSIQGSLVGRQPPQGYHHISKPPQLRDGLFYTINEARTSLMSLFIESLKPIRPGFNYNDTFTMLGSEQSQRAALIGQLHQWNSQMDSFTTELLNGLTKQELNIIHLLQIQCLVAIIWNSTTIPPSEGLSIEPSFDAYTDMFNKIILLAESLVNNSIILASTSHSTPSSISTPSIASSVVDLSPRPRTPTSHLQRTFSIELGLIFALYFVAIKCRSPMLRRRAVEFLSRVEPRVEGMWDARVLEKIACYVIEIEEICCVEPVTEDEKTWPKVEWRVEAIYIFPTCDYDKGVQRIRCFRSSNEKLGDEWEVDVQF